MTPECANRLGARHETSRFGGRFVKRDFERRGVRREFTRRRSFSRASAAGASPGGKLFVAPVMEDLSRRKRLRWK